MNKKTIQDYNNLISYSCRKLNIELPDIYYISYKNAGFVMYDDHLNIISYDDRDVPFFINGFHFVGKEYVIYINTKLLDNPVLANTVALMVTREIYQRDQINKLINKKPLAEEEATVNGWKFAYEISDWKPNKLSPPDTDKKAFAIYMMKKLYNLSITYETVNKSELDKRIYKLTIQLK